MIPGFKNKKMIRDLNQIFNTPSVSLLANYTKRMISYISDLNGKLQVCVCPNLFNRSGIALLLVASSPAMAGSIVNRPALGNCSAMHLDKHLETRGAHGRVEKAGPSIYRHHANYANETVLKAALMNLTDWYFTAYITRNDRIQKIGAEESKKICGLQIERKVQSNYFAHTDVRN